MEFKLNYSPKFLEDLLSIGDYTELQLLNPSGAERITNGIMDATDILAKYPETGARIFLPGGLDSGYRFVVFEDYLAVYQIRLIYGAELESSEEVHMQIGRAHV